MNPFVAAAASVCWVFLIALLFQVFSIKKMPTWAKLLIFCAIWVIWTFVRLRLPVVQDWWLPHLGYAIWRNAGILQLAGLGGEAMLELAVLVSNLVLALSWFNHKQWLTVGASMTLLSATLCANLLITQIPIQSYRGIIAIQSAGDIDQLKTMTVQALAATRNDSDRTITVIWSENHLEADDAALAIEFARTVKVNLIINTTDDQNHNVVEMYNPDGNKILQNLKYHIAPGEHHLSGWSNNIFDNLTAFICYDVHYPDIVARIGSADLVFVPINDSDFASTEKTFHLADVATRAATTRSNFVLASIDGPTAFVDRYGRVVRELPYEATDFLVE